MVRLSQSGRGASKRERMARYDPTAAFRSDDPRIQEAAAPDVAPSPHEVATSGGWTTKSCDRPGRAWSALGGFFTFLRGVHGSRARPLPCAD